MNKNIILYAERHEEILKGVSPGVSGYVFVWYLHVYMHLCIDTHTHAYMKDSYDIAACISRYVSFCHTYIHAFIGSCSYEYVRLYVLLCTRIDREYILLQEHV